MNLTLAAAALLAILIGAVHSALGERRIFNPAERSGDAAIGGRYSGILRASWHATTLFGWALAAMLLWFAQAPLAFPQEVRVAAVLSLTLSALLVLVWTCGRHHGWIGLGTIAALCALA
jgi:hypothetical protein